MLQVAEAEAGEDAMGGQGGGGGGAHRVQALAPTHDLYITCNTIGCKGGSLVSMFGPRPLALDGQFTCGHLCKW